MNIIINISGVYSDESWSLPGAQTVDLRNLEGCCCYCDSQAEAVLRKEIAPFAVTGIHWIDTGDYHYISKLWMEKISEPFILALFDNHPDDQPTAFGGLLSCGSWVQAARDVLPMMKADYLNTSVIPGNLPVYLSIDLDIMPRQFARTDWDQGDMSPGQLLSAISRIAAGHRIIGADICGGLTRAKGALPEDLAINRKVRDMLQEHLSQLTRTV